jgi:hypothetical protein
VEQLAENGAAEEHIDAVRNEIGHVRYHPTEVAAASSIAPPAATLEAVLPHDAALREIMAR